MLMFGFFLLGRRRCILISGVRVSSRFPTYSAPPYIVVCPGDHFLGCISTFFRLGVFDILFTNESQAYRPSLEPEQKQEQEQEPKQEPESVPEPEPSVFKPVRCSCDKKAAPKQGARNSPNPRAGGASLVASVLREFDRTRTCGSTCSVSVSPAASLPRPCPRLPSGARVFYRAHHHFNLVRLIRESILETTKFYIRLEKNSPVETSFEFLSLRLAFCVSHPQSPQQQ